MPSAVMPTLSNPAKLPQPSSTNKSKPVTPAKQKPSQIAIKPVTSPPLPTSHFTKAVTPTQQTSHIITKPVTPTHPPINLVTKPITPTQTSQHYMTSQFMTTPASQVIVTKLATPQKPASTSKVTPTSTSTTKCGTINKTATNGTATPLPVTFTKSKQDIIVMEKSKQTCNVTTATSVVKDNGRKK